ncbi:MAG: dTDP-4-dehydrorhamnose reductase [Prevotella sp.]|nr:dTDP-4-dehydrorhamnose reductase [Prevotella sp.]
MNILITGCRGQLGSELLALEENYPSFKFFNTDIEELDITSQKDVEDFMWSNSIDGIVNCAAYTQVDGAETNIKLSKKLNAEAPGFLASAIEKRGGWIIQISTDYVFNGKSFFPYTEMDRPSPESVYGTTKLQGELIVSELCQRAMIIRTSWLYSSYGNNFVKTMMRLGKEKETLNVVFDQVGTPTYARDLAISIMTIISKGVKRGVYHFSNEGVTSWYDFTKAIHELSGITSCRVYPIHTSEYPTAAVRPHYSVLDKSKIKQAYNFEIPYWKDSLKDCIELLNS